MSSSDLTVYMSMAYCRKTSGYHIEKDDTINKMDEHDKFSISSQLSDKEANNDDFEHSISSLDRDIDLFSSETEVEGIQSHDVHSIVVTVV